MTTLTVTDHNGRVYMLGTREQCAAVINAWNAQALPGQWSHRYRLANVSTTSRWRVERVNNRWLLCGGILRYDQVKPGQVWAPASGEDRTVRVYDTSDGWVDYAWYENGQARAHTKDSFSFQCRYCLVLPTPEVPKEIL